ncbi:hypothetical protein [Actinomadura violacea]|uniref:Lsr2 protein n=1 Tax=Actinomadura violacea TaxID=2819934 RepID=A0ABS3RWN1_9ACTN|nr:hypothetical protein [Actinomadura violacea]MBO2461176.1 hypothetical protein [Actinomadura violacea]
MRFDIETPLAGYKGTVGGVTFVDGRARVDDTQKAELAYFRRHNYKITPVRERAGTDDADSVTAPAEPSSEAGPEAEQPTQDGEAPSTSERPDPTEDTAEGFDSSSLTDALKAAAASGSTGDGAGDAAEQLRKPAKNAPVAAWTAYAKQLGITDDELGGKTKNELVELVDQHEKKEAGQ